MRQSDDGSVERAIAAAMRTEDRIVQTVVDDVVRPGEDRRGLEPQVRVALRWLVDALRERASPESLEPLRAQATETARAGGPVGPLLDRYLSAGWALWEAVAAGGEIPRQTLADLGTRLLRAGDAAAAAIADAYAEAEGELAARAASARREFLDELLAYRPGDPTLVRLTRRAAAYALAPSSPVRVLVVATRAELDDDDPAVGRISRELGPRAALIATDRGRLLLLLRPVVVSDALAGRLFDEVFGHGDWLAVSEDSAGGLAGVGIAVARAHAALAVAERAGGAGRIIAAERLSFERALLADEALLAEGAAVALAPLATTPRTGDQLVETLRVFLETAGNRRETARRLKVAPRTVAYRLTRIEERVGGRLAGPTLLRLAAAIYAAGLVSPRDR